MIANTLIILVIIGIIGILLRIYYLSIHNIHVVPEDQEMYTITSLTEAVKTSFNTILKANLLDMNLTKEELERKNHNKSELRKALKDCAYGDSIAKAYIKEFIKDLLQTKFHIDESNINELIPFQSPKELTEQDCFEIMLYRHKLNYGNEALDYIMQAYGLDDAKYDQNGEFYYEVTKDDIHRIYRHNEYRLSYDDKLNLVSQRIFQLYKGYGAIDEIRDMRIDGISGGVSGIPEGMYNLLHVDALRSMPCSFDSIWMFYKGKTIHLSFLSFGSQKELERVCRNIYRYNSPGQLSESKGYMINEMKDGSRIVVARPPMAESWVFWVRKFDSVVNTDIYSLIPSEGNELPISLMKWLIKGCLIIAITGTQGCGKTTLLMSLIQFINRTFTLRIQELAFELHLRKLYPERNIVTFKETSDISGQEGLNLQKKTDGTVNILGEVAEASVSSWMIQMAQVASKMTMFTHHAKTSENLVSSLRNALIQECGFNNEKIAEQQVAEVVNIDIHMEKDNAGNRYIERITEIVPLSEHTRYSDAYLRARNSEEIQNRFLDNINDYFYRVTDRPVYETRDIIRYENGRYIAYEPLSDTTIKKLQHVLTPVQYRQFLDDMRRLGGYAYES